MFLLGEKGFLAGTNVEQLLLIPSLSFLFLMLNQFYGELSHDPVPLLVSHRTNVVMNYSEVEAKVREATNDDTWGPHGSLMSEISKYTFTYEHYPEVMSMLWKRMFETKKNWRRTYKVRKRGLQCNHVSQVWLHTEGGYSILSALMVVPQLLLLHKYTHFSVFPPPLQHTHTYFFLFP